MKFRKGFVTNSSSSSFILAYNENSLEKNIWKQLKENYDIDEAGEYFAYLMNFIEKSKNVKNDEEFLDNLKESFYYTCRYELQNEIEKKGTNWEDAYNYVKSEKGKLEVNEMVQKKINELIKSFQNFDTIKKIEIFDDYEPFMSLEHNVVKDLEECKAKISHH